MAGGGPRNLTQAFLGPVLPNESNRIGLCVQGTFALELDLKVVFN